MLRKIFNTSLTLELKVNVRKPYSLLLLRDSAALRLGSEWETGSIDSSFSENGSVRVSVWRSGRARATTISSRNLSSSRTCLCLSIRYRGAVRYHHQPRSRLRPPRRRRHRDSPTARARPAPKSPRRLIRAAPYIQLPLSLYPGYPGPTLQLYNSRNCLQLSLHSPPLPMCVPPCVPCLALKHTQLESTPGVEFGV